VVAVTVTTQIGPGAFLGYGEITLTGTEIEAALADGSVGWKITSNYVNFNEVDFWNTFQSEGLSGGFNFIQSSAGTQVSILSILGDGTFTQVNLGQAGFTGFLYADAAEISYGTGDDVPVLIYSNNQVALSFDELPYLPPKTFAQLPASPTTGMLARITNSTTAAWDGVVAGGGANDVLAWFRAGNWRVIGG